MLVMVTIKQTFLTVNSLPQWLQGMTEIPVNTPIVSVSTITVAMWQARAALRRAHLLDQADAAVNASGNGDLIEYWQYATVLDEGNVMVKTLAAIIGISEKQMHDLFLTAAAIRV